MNDGNGPWRKNTGAGNSVRLIVWLALLFAAGLLIWNLDAVFPGQVSSDDVPYLLYSVLILALVSSGVIFARNVKAKEVLRNIAIWAAIAVILLLGYSYRDELRTVAMRIRGDLVPGYAVTSEPGVMMLTASSDGHFYVFSEINGTRIRFLIDTGASDIVLSPSDAKRIGIDVQTLDFSRVYQTANGLGRGAPITLETMSVGPMELSNVQASVNQADMGESLLGMSFLNRMASFEIQGQKLFLRWRQ